MRGQVDLAEAALPDEPAQRITADRLQVVGGEFTGARVSACHSDEVRRGVEVQLVYR